METPPPPPKCPRNISYSIPSFTRVMQRPRQEFTPNEQLNK